MSKPACVNLGLECLSYVLSVTTAALALPAVTVTIPKTPLSSLPACRAIHTVLMESLLIVSAVK